LAPKRYGLPPHDVERAEMQKDWERIAEKSREKQRG
jgi:predicted metallo-beta-lactamase superfamily hydrolase